MAEPQLLRRDDHPADADDVPVEIEMDQRPAVENFLVVQVLVERDFAEVGGRLETGGAQRSIQLAGINAEELGIALQERLEDGNRGPLLEGQGPAVRPRPLHHAVGVGRALDARLDWWQSAVRSRIRRVRPTRPQRWRVGPFVHERQRAV
jgi:hypothetical protein